MSIKIEINNDTDDATCFVGVRVTDPLLLPDNVISQCTECFYLIQHRPDVPKHLKMMCMVCAGPVVRQAAATDGLQIRISQRHKDEFLQWLETHKRHRAN